MSELQTALLLIGVVVMVAVYGYGWWQQRRLSRKFGATFKANHADALYHAAPAESVVEHRLDEPVVVDEPPRMVVEPTAVQAVNVVPSVLDESCALLDRRSDFMIELELAEPANGAVLDGFWQRKFDFGKAVHVCGLTLHTQRWERVIAEGQTLYVSLRVALQLVDRGGIISVTKLADFRDLVASLAKQIHAEIRVDDLPASHAQAVELDALCAEVDQMVGINLVPPRERLLLASRIAEAAAVQGMRLESDGAFHLFDEQGLSVFSLINQDNQPFLHHTLATASSAGITLLLDVPRVAEPAARFDAMTQVAHALARELQLNLVDDQRVVLRDSGLEHIRMQITAVENKMRANGLLPGSAQARRLFS